MQRSEEQIQSGSIFKERLRFKKGCFANDDAMTLKMVRMGKNM
jgi:hypothetical protein